MQSNERLKVLEKIEYLEKTCQWDKDVEDDPITIELKPDKVDYLCEKFGSKLINKIANRVAINHFEKQIKKGAFTIKEVRGYENYLSVKGGAILTCNHFSPYDNYAVYRTIKKDLGPSKCLYKVIREGNYTNFKGLYGFLFKHCNTLPLSSNIVTMKKFMGALKILLSRGEKVLIYPEQAMWWNYKKPRPMKNGAFQLAVKNNVPIIPIFITMEDSDILDADGFNTKIYTMHFLKPIFPRAELSQKDNIEFLKEENYRVWKETYEEVYGLKLEYLKEE
ncbi:MAG: 1-acyl-sn-glycerol-3-phosphate acyltransferase [Clostridia bacterium]|nr:1-acyl-sn-glycerol-3-phosphate acyltransferase [Clostridia bacterium]